MAGNKYDITSSPIWADVKDIISSDKKPVKYTYHGTLHTEKEDIPVLKLRTIDVARDYVNKIGDEIQIEFMMGMGDYVARLYPYRTNLEFTIKKTLLQETTDSHEPDTPAYTEKYKAIFLPDLNVSPAGTSIEQIDTESLNLADLVNVKLQLIDRSLEPLRIKTVCGVFRGVTAHKLIHALLVGESSKVSVEGRPAIDGADIVEPDNKTARSHVIPSGTLIAGLPTYIHETGGGVYTTGIGTYLQSYKKKKLWFVYPLFNTRRFDKSQDNKLIVYAVPEGRLDGVDRSYAMDGTVLKVVIGSDKQYEDSADTDYINYGSGFRMADARAMMKKPVKLSDEGPKASRGRLNFEVVAEERKDGLNYAPTVATPSSNPYKEYSKITQRNIAKISLKWENADPDLIYPGMPCKYVFTDEGKIVELKGTVGFIHAFTTLQSNGIMGNTSRTVCSVVLLCEQKPATREVTALEA